MARRWAGTGRRCWACRALGRAGVGAQSGKSEGAGRRAGVGADGSAGEHALTAGERQLGAGVGGRASAAGRAGARGMRLQHGRWRLRHGRPWLRHGRAKGHDTATMRAWACLCTPGCAQLGLVGCFVHSDSVFDPVRLSTIPESPNEHCSL